MRKYLLPEQGNFYKANLHCHTTLSDASATPSEVKDIYKALGYSIVAYTDHDLLIPHDDLTDDTFLALHGFEIEVTESKKAPWPELKCCHICLIGIDKDNITQPMWSEDYLFGNSPNNIDKVKYDTTQPKYVRHYSGEGVSEMIRIGRESGFFVTYNHPTWSQESYPEYMGYNGMHAMEMFNGTGLVHGYDDYAPRVYDDMLRGGKHIYCIGGDDNHNHKPNTRFWDSGVAFTMIKADKLDYETITTALVNGSFYASQAPEIYELWTEDGKIHIECSDADKIYCTYGKRQAEIVYAEGDTPATSADFTFRSDYGYARITIVDKSGKVACTNAYFPEA